MLRNRVLILLGGCLLMASAALADDLGYIACNTHPEETQIFAKARKSQDVVGTIPCGERFKIVLYGFIFSEIQTADGKVGFVYSSILTIDHGVTLQSRAGSDATPRLSTASETTKIPADPKAAAPKRTATNVGGANSIVEQPAGTPAAVQSAAAPSPASTASDASAPAADSRGSSAAAAVAAVAAAAAPTQPAPAVAPAPTLPDAATVQKATEAVNPDAAPAVPKTSDTAKEAAATDSQAVATAQPTAEATPAVAPATPAAPPTADIVAADNVSSATEAAPTAAPTLAEPAAPAAQPQPRPVESAKIKTESWEKPNPGGRNASLLEFFGGFAYSRMNAGGGVSNNFLGGVGSFGINIKPWLQISGDSSYNYYNVSGTKYVLYGNHYGPRFYWRRHNRFGVTPFGEALFGGSRQDANWPASGGNAAYTISTNGFSWKVGGGLDMRASRLFEIRLIDVDYYRTSFGSGTNQSNYWVSTGVVLRLFRSWSDQ